MTLEVVILPFPAVLALHNIDEYLQHGEFAAVHHSRLPERFRTRRVFGWAATLLTVAVAGLCVLMYVYRGPTLRSIAEISIFALFWNAVGHCALSAMRRSMVPGTRSACALVLPYSAAAICLMHVSLGMSFETLLGYAAVGAVTGPLAAIVFLPIGYGISRL
jgi:hypothetical protein